MDNSGCNEETKITEAWGRSKFKEHTVKYTWVIDQFPIWIERIADDEEYSPTFSAGDRQWRLRLSANLIHNNENKDYISLFLSHLQSLKSKVLTKFKIGILDNKERPVSVHYSDNSDLLDYVVFNSKTTDDAWGWDQFIRKDILLNKGNGYLSNDTLTLFCEVRILDRSLVAGSGSYTALAPQPKVILPECHLTSNFQNFLQSQFLSDVILAVGTKEFPSHKLMLSGASPVFAAMFGHDMTENLENRVEVKDIDASVFEEFLHFIYTGKVNNLEKNAADLLVVAERYGVERLKALCEESLASQLSVENTLRMHELAILHNANQLKTITIKFFKENSGDVSKSDEFFSLMLQEMALTEKNS